MPDCLPDNAVETEHLCKTYRGGKRHPGKEALKDVSLAIPRGSFFGLLGPNGAGKSTLINILAGLVVKTAGSARVWGHDIATEMRAARSSIGIVPQELNIDPFFTPRELLEVQAGLYGVALSKRRTDAILELVGLAEQANAYTRSLSGGMRRRLLVAKAMVHSPPVLVLDEPTAGVDVDLRRQLWVNVRELRRRGTTIVLTTHYLEEAQALCNHIAIIDRGRIVIDDSTENLLSRIDAKQMTVTVDRELAEVPPPLRPYGAELVNGRRLVFRYPPSRTPTGEILKAVESAGLAVIDVSTKEADLEQIFLQLTRHDGAPEAV